MPSNKFVYSFFWLSMHILKFMQSPESETVFFIEIAYFFTACEDQRPIQIAVKHLSWSFMWETLRILTI